MDRIDHLRIFGCVAASGSFTRAANQLDMARASVSLAIAQLEAQLGTRLLNRTTRRVSLTPDGEALLDRAAALVADMDELAQQFRPAASGAVAGRLRVDLPSRIARRIVATALPGFLARHPGIDLELGSNDRAVDLVQEGVDCALRVGPLAASSLVARPLGSFALVNCASPAYLAAHGTPTCTDDLAQHVAVAYSSPTSGRTAPWEWQQGGQTRAMRLRSRVATNHVETYIACALAGLGLVQVPRFDVAGDLASGRLVEVLPQARPPAMPVHLVYPHRHQLSRRLQVFNAWVVELLAPHLDAEAD